MQLPPFANISSFTTFIHRLWCDKNVKNIFSTKKYVEVDSSSSDNQKSSWCLILQQTNIQDLKSSKAWTKSSLSSLALILTNSLIKL